MIIQRNKIDDHWTDTSFLRTDGQEEFREKPQHGNRHAVFPKNSSTGKVHVDKHNALDFPVGSIYHLVLYIEEKTRILQIIAGGIIMMGRLILTAKLFNALEDQ